MKTKRLKWVGVMLATVLSLALMITAFAACGDETVDDGPGDEPQQIAVTEVTLELEKTTARIGETLTAKVTVRPSNATDKEYSLSSANDKIAKINAENAVECVGSGSVIITARAKNNPSKKAEVKLVVLGSDESGRYENLYEAEDANLIPAESSNLRVEVTDDDRISGTGVVSNLSKGDRLVWGVQSSAEDTDAVLRFRLMGPSGWLGMWDSIPYKFADWYTVTLNGKTVPTENIHVEGTLNRAGSADYYAVKDIMLGGITLKKDLNVVTFVVSNRYDQKTINDGTYNGTLSCWGNVDSMTILSSKELTYVADTTEGENTDPDVAYKTVKMEVEAATSRIYEDEEHPNVDLNGQTFVEFKPGMNIFFGMNAGTAMKAKLRFGVAAPYVDASTPMTDVALGKLVGVNLDGKTVDVGGLTVKGNDLTGTKENFTEVETGWIDLKADANTLGVVAKDNPDYTYAGGLDYVEVVFCEGSVTPFLVEAPKPQSTVRFEAEADTTKRVGYGDLTAGATVVELKDAYKVQTDVYKNKLETTKIIFGVEADTQTFATLKMRFAAPYTDASTAMTDIGVGSLGDLWVNGTLVSTPETLKGNDAVGTKENFTEITIGKQIELQPGKNRIVWEPQNYTGNAYEYFGALDYIDVTSTATLTAYEVNFWTDRNTYFDDANNEPIMVTCDKISDSTPNSCWIAVYRAEDSVSEKQPGSLYWYYPSGAYGGTPSLNEAVNILAMNPNSQRPLIGAATGGHYKVVYFEKDTLNANGGYDIVDCVYISVWDDPGNYGGRI